ncbi:MAG: PilZ domain-containing protein [Proteobacteria bacterium]|nr:PilZ domain-containing protein [Pseudomonadota bacterium]
MFEKRHFRSSSRSQIACEITLYRTESSSDNAIVSHSRDIGMGGLFAETEEVFEIGDMVKVVLSTLSTWEPIELTAEICRCQPPNNNQSGGVGLRFVNITDIQAVALNEFTDSLDFNV